MAKEYIERDSLVAEIAKGTIITDDIYGMGIMTGLGHALNVARAAPAADVVEVGTLKAMLSALESKCFGDGVENYTTGYRNGHRNGQIELLRYILRVPEGTSEDARMDGE